MSDLVFVDDYKDFRIKIFFGEQGHVAHIERVSDGVRVGSTIHYTSRIDAYREAELIIDSRLAQAPTA